MGPSGYSKPPTLSKSWIIGLVFVLSILFNSAEAQLLGLNQGDSSNGGSLGSSIIGNACNLVHCTDWFKQASDNLYQDDPTLKNLDAICKMYREYRSCVTSQPDCRGDIAFHAVRKIIRDELEENKCAEVDEEEERHKKARDNHNAANGRDRNKDGGKHRPNRRGGSVDGDDEGGRRGTRPQRPPARPPPSMCVYQGPQVYRHCGLFGDPHLRTFQGDFQTCKVQGAWPLVQNDFLTVQVTNAPVEGSNTEVTATSKLTVIVKGNAECTSENYATYQAQSNMLPSTFDDGRTHVGPYHSLELVEMEPEAHVEIRIHYISTVVVVRRIGRYFTFSIRMPEALLNGTTLDGQPIVAAPVSSFPSSSSSSSSAQDAQLCMRGCPDSELIDFQEYLASRRYHVEKPRDDDASSDGSHLSEMARAALETSVPTTRSEAEIVCREAGVVGFYFDFCVFDLMATGDQNFTLAAVAAMKDVLRLDPSAARLMDNRTSLEVYDQKYPGNGAFSKSGVGAAWWWRTSVAGITALVLGMGGGHHGEAWSQRSRASAVMFLMVLTFLLMLCSR